MEGALQSLSPEVATGVGKYILPGGIQSQEEAAESLMGGRIETATLADQRTEEGFRFAASFMAKIAEALALLTELKAMITIQDYSAIKEEMAREKENLSDRLEIIKDRIEENQRIRRKIEKLKNSPLAGLLKALIWALAAALAPMTAGVSLAMAVMETQNGTFSSMVGKMVGADDDKPGTGNIAMGSMLLAMAPVVPFFGVFFIPVGATMIAKGVDDNKIAADRPKWQTDKTELYEGQAARVMAAMYTQNARYLAMVEEGLEEAAAFKAAIISLIAVLLNMVAALKAAGMDVDALSTDANLSPEAMADLQGVSFLIQNDVQRFQKEVGAPLNTSFDLSQSLNTLDLVALLDEQVGKIQDLVSLAKTDPDALRQDRNAVEEIGGALVAVFVVQAQKTGLSKFTPEGEITDAERVSQDYLQTMLFESIYKMLEVLHPGGGQMQLSREEILDGLSKSYEEGKNALEAHIDSFMHMQAVGEAERLGELTRGQHGAA